MIICQCAAVTDRSLTEAVEAGARSLRQLCRVTNAGRDCGACVFNVRRVIAGRAAEGGMESRVRAA